MSPLLCVQSWTTQCPLNRIGDRSEPQALLGGGGLLISLSQYTYLLCGSVFLGCNQLRLTMLLAIISSLQMLSCPSVGLYSDLRNLCFSSVNICVCRHFSKWGKKNTLFIMMLWLLCEKIKYMKRGMRKRNVIGCKVMQHLWSKANSVQPCCCSPNDHNISCEWSGYDEICERPIAGPGELFNHTNIQVLRASVACDIEAYAETVVSNGQDKQPHGKSCFRTVPIISCVITIEKPFTNYFKHTNA